jgi:hypothetical protein
VVPIALHIQMLARQAGGDELLKLFGSHFYVWRLA